MRTVWVRHGESEYNAKNLATGWHDPLLTEKGINQAAKTAKELANRYQSVDSIHCSDLKRAAQTASIIVQLTPWFVDVKIDPRLRERDYGTWSGCDKNQNKLSVGQEQYLAIRRGWKTAPPEGESLEQTSVRVADYLDNIEQSNVPIIFVCHGNTIRAASVIFGKNTPESVVDWEIETGGFVEWEY